MVAFHCARERINPFRLSKISTTADHYHYLPMLAVSAAAVWLTDRLARWHRPVYVVSAVVVVILFCVTALRIPVWKKDETFFKDMAAYAPTSYSSAIGMSIVMCQDLKEYAQGVQWTELALKERPNDISALANQAFCHFHSGNHFRVAELDFYLDQMNLHELEKHNRLPIRVCLPALVRVKSNSKITKRDFNTSAKRIV